MKRIGVLLESDTALGGAFQYSQSILSALQKLPATEFQVVALYVDPRWEESIEAGVERVRVQKTFVDRAVARSWRAAGLPIAVRRFLAPVLNSVARALIRARCDIWIFPVQDVWAYEAPVVALATIHDVMHRYAPEFPETGSKRERAMRDRHYSLISRYAAGILVDSEMGKQHVIESYHVKSEKVYPLPYVAPSYLGSGEEDVPKEYGLPSKFIFYPAHFWHHKNHVRLLEAVARVAEKSPDIHLVLVGSPKNGFAFVKREANRLGVSDRVSFLGQVPDRVMPALYRRARALVMPTFFGPTNIPPLEAFVTGCPVGISNIYSIPEQVGDAALLFDPKSVNEITECIERLWNDDALCSSLAAKGRQMAERWGPVQFAERLRRIVDAVTEKT